MKINCILLAAGNSTRFEGNKLLTELKGKPLICYPLERITQLNIDDKIIVTQNQKVADYATQHEITALHNPNPDLGLSYSIELGIRATDDADGYLFVVSDQPLLSRTSLSGIVDTFIQHNGEKIVCAGYGDDLGNPVIFPSRFKEDLLNLEGDHGGRSIYRNHMDDVVIHPVSSGVELYDIDTKEEFQFLSEQVLG